MPVPQDIHRHLIIARFQRRRHFVAGILVLIAAAGAYIGFLALNHSPASPISLPVRDRIGIAVLAIVLAMLIVYVHYRCPNCNVRSWGKAWLGIDPTRCPSCKSSLK